MTKIQREVRAFGEVRADEVQPDGDAVSFRGYAAVFNDPADIGGMFREQIAPGAFARAIKEKQDVRLLLEHEGLPLARTRSGTLALSEDATGLLVTAELDASDPDVQRIIPKMRRGDLNQMSFGFFVKRQVWDDSTDPALRTIEDVDLFDVSLVTIPAYDNTEAALRSLAAHRTTATPAIMRRLRMKHAHLERGVR